MVGKPSTVSHGQGMVNWGRQDHAVVRGVREPAVDERLATREARPRIRSAPRSRRRLTARQGGASAGSPPLIHATALDETRERAPYFHSDIAWDERQYDTRGLSGLQDLIALSDQLGSFVTTS